MKTEKEIKEWADLPNEFKKGDYAVVVCKGVEFASNGAMDYLVGKTIKIRSICSDGCYSMEADNITNEKWWFGSSSLRPATATEILQYQTQELQKYSINGEEQKTDCEDNKDLGEEMDRIVEFFGDKSSRFRMIATELSDLYAKKNKDYGDSFGETFKELWVVSAITRMKDKLNRFTNLTTKGNQQVNDESIRAILDLAAYAIMTAIELENKEKI